MIQLLFLINTKYSNLKIGIIFFMKKISNSLIFKNNSKKIIFVLEQNLQLNMAEQSNNVINNYKGVMLCSRPNQKRAAESQKPFCARVVPGEQIGLVPIKKQIVQTDSPTNKQITALEKHKKWLHQFKGNIQKTKEEIDQKTKKEEQKFKKIRQQAEVDRDRARKMKQQYNQTATQVLNVLDQKVPPQPSSSNQLNSDNLRRLDALNEQKKGNQFKKKSDKPVWAMTKEQVQENEEKQVDELLDFFESNNVQDYSQDQEVKELLSNLKQKIQKMKETQDWKEKQVERIKKEKEERRNAPEGEDDKYSHFSVNSEGKSIASQKTQKKLQELRNKKAQQQEWDKFTTSQKNSMANYEEKIAKNLADQVLRNYPNMKGVHSNTSIRRLLQAQAAKVLNQPIMRPVITTIVKEKQPMNANTLPYLHRNPAI